MHGFSYKNGSLHCEDVDLSTLADEYGTPLYVYSAGTILDHYRRLDAALGGVAHEVAYAVKANSNLSVLRLLANEGAGFDIVSGGELFRVIKAGGDPAHCTFAGVGKTRAEIVYALEQGIYSFNVESEEELRYLNQVAGELGMIAPAAVRVNPNVDAKTHKYISTGKSREQVRRRFRIDLPDCLTRRARPNCRTSNCAACKCTSARSSPPSTPFVEAVEKVTPLVKQLKAAPRHRVLVDRRRHRHRLQGLARVRRPGLVGNQDSRKDRRSPSSSYGAEIVPLLEDLGTRRSCWSPAVSSSATPACC